MVERLFNEFKDQFHNGNWQNAVIASIAIIFILSVSHLVAFRLIKYIGRRRQKSLLVKVYRRFRIPSIVFIMIIALSVIFYAFAPDDQVIENIKHGLKLLAIVSFTWLLISLIGLGKEIILSNYDINKKDNLKERRVYTQLKILENILNFIVILIAIAASLMTFESIQKIGVSLFASAGVAGIILGFAAQKLIATVLAGFQIAITQPIRLDDAVIVENEWGWIEEINLTYVVLRIWDKRRLVLPTTYFIEKPFQNWTRVSSDIMGTVFLHTDYNVPFDELRSELTRILNTDKRWDGKVNVMQVTDATPTTVEIRILVSAADSPSAWDLRVNVREQMIKFLQKNYPESLPRTRIRIEETKDIRNVNRFSNSKE